MRRNALAAVILAAGWLAGCDQISKRVHEYDITHGALDRVKTILDGVKLNGRRDQKSLCLWYDGSLYIEDEHEQSLASDTWDRWIIAGGLVEGISAFEVTESILDPEADDANTALVSGTIDGRAFTMLVPKGKSIAWVQAPSGTRTAARRSTSSRSTAPRSAPAERPAASEPAADEAAPVRQESTARTAVEDKPAPMDESAIGAAPLSAQEQAGVAFAVMYLRGGAAAWQKMLAGDSPWKSLSAAEATAEITARVGPPDATHWQLQHPGPNGASNDVVFSVEYPSGMTETVWLEIASEKGGMKLRHVRVLSEPWPLPPRETPKFEHIAGSPGLPVDLPGAPLAAVLATAALVGAMALALAGRGRRRLGWAAIALAGIGFACARGKGGAAAPRAADAGKPERLGALVPLREALAEGASGEALTPLLAAAPKDGAAGDIARLWRADRMLRDYRLNEADAILQTFPSPAPYPLTALLRARLAVLRGQADDSLAHYEVVRALGADDDSLRLEAAIAISSGDEEGAGDRAFSRLTTMGSRESIPYYVAAENAMAEDRGEEAEKLFQIGWELQPLSRDTLFSSPLLAAVCTRKAAYPLIDAGAAAEPRRGGPIPGDQPLPLPAEAQASLVGGLLRVRLFGAELRVPGGQKLAPAGAVVVPADEFERSERDEQVEQLAVLVEQANADGAFAQPVLRRRLELAARGLAEREQWADLLTLTDKLPAFSGRLPPRLTRLRAAALARSDRAREAFDLLVRLAQDDKLHGRRDTGTLYQLADALVREQKFDLALKVLQRANAISGLSSGLARERQVRMEKKLAESHEIFETPHFRIRYPKQTGNVYAQQLAVVLEEERKRLAHWIPVAKPKPVDVDLYPVDEFLASYAAEMPVVGIFDGRVRVPFADLHSLHPKLVSILTHELAHALISQATGDKAPSWVQEGLAQHVQMVQEVHNPFPDLEPVGLSLSLAVVEHALRGFSEQQFVEMSYAEAAWTFHYLETKHGTAGIHRLLAAYAKGGASEAALKSGLGMDTAQLDGALRKWATTPGLPRLWPTKLRRYDHEAAKLALMTRTETVPKVASSGTSRFGDQREIQARAMATWHASYLRWSQPLKVAYTPVQKAVSGGTTWTATDQAACRRLAETTSKVIDQHALFEAPDRRIAYPLQQAMITLNKLGGACARNDLAQARVFYSQVNGWFDKTTKLFAEYKLPL